MLSHLNMANLSISQQLNIVMFIICLFKCFEASFSISLSVQTNTVENHLLDSLAIRDYLSTNSVIATNNANNSGTTPYNKLTKLSLIDEYDDTLQNSQESSLLLSNPTLLNQSKLNQLRQLYQQSSANAYQTEQIFYTFAYSLIIVSSFLGNLLVCKVCLKNMTKTNALILSLAASDLAMTIFNIPFNYFRLHNYSWPFGSVMCFLVNFVQHLVVYNSSYTMAIIAIQRYYSVCWIVFPFQQKSQSAQRIFSQPNRKYSSQLCSMRTIYVSIFITWSFSIIISTLFTFTSTTVIRKDIFSSIVAMYISKQQQHNKQSHWNSTYHSSNYHHLDDFPTVVRCTNPVPDSVEHYFHKNVSIKADFAKSIVVFVTQYFIPLSISCCLYIRIGKTISRQGKLASIRGNPKAQIRQRKKRRRIIMLVLVVAVFALCWLPLHAFHLFTDAGLVNYNYQVFMMVHWIAMSSVCYNPFIYCWLNKHFRKAAIRIFCVCRNVKSEKYSVKTIVTNRTDILDISEVNNTNLQIFELIKPTNESPQARPLEQLLKPSNSSSRPCPVSSTAICITNSTSIGNSNHDSDKLVLTTHL